MPLTAGNYVLRKLPHITALFWAIKILATTLGETAGDYFSQTLGLGTLHAAVLLIAIFLVAVTIQLRASRFHPALFWTVVVLTSTAGTTISDFINYTSGLGQATGALILGSGLALVLLIWWRSGQTLNVENVATLTGEVLFWIAVVFSNSLGTSTGDYLAGGLGLGLRPTALLLTAAMLVLLAAHYFTNINGMLLFWIAFILTRPWGAVVGNILSKSRDHGGLEWGNAGASAVLIDGLVILVGYQTLDIRRHPLEPLPLPMNRHTGQPQRPNGKSSPSRQAERCAHVHEVERQTSLSQAKSFGRHQHWPGAGRRGAALPSARRNHAAAGHLARQHELRVAPTGDYGPQGVPQQFVCAHSGQIGSSANRFGPDHKDPGRTGLGCARPDRG